MLLDEFSLTAKNTTVRLGWSSLVRSGKNFVQILVNFLIYCRVSGFMNTLSKTDMITGKFSCDFHEEYYDLKLKFFLLLKFVCIRQDSRIYATKQIQISNLYIIAILFSLF